MTKKILFCFIGIVVVCLVLSWAIPVKFSVKSEDLKKYSEGYVVLLCTPEQVTGPLWRVLDFYGTESCPDYVDIIWNIPENSLRHPMYEYPETKFIFIGSFPPEYNHGISGDDEWEHGIFAVSEWEVVGEISRAYNIIPLPSNYFNSWEMDIFKSE